jgi:uncharacterized protein (DUF1778 family)
MEENKERKSNAITARITDDDLGILDDLSDYTNKNKSDTITRAVKFWRNVVDTTKITAEDTEKWGEVTKNVRVNLRVTDSDKHLFDECSAETGLSTSQIIRKALREYHNSIHR